MSRGIDALKQQLAQINRDILWVDKLVAYHLFGWRCIRWEDCSRAGILYKFHPPCNSAWIQKQHGVTFTDEFLPDAEYNAVDWGNHFTWKEEAMFRVIDKMAERGFWCRMDTPFSPGDQYGAGFTPHSMTRWNGISDNYTKAAALPLAVALAALKALGVEIGGNNVDQG